jgi:hypothetical protein
MSLETPIIKLGLRRFCPVGHGNEALAFYPNSDRMQMRYASKNSCQSHAFTRWSNAESADSKILAKPIAAICKSAFTGSFF